MKLNWFSPLAPARSEIAHYTARTVAALRGHAEVTLWTDQAKWDSAWRTSPVCGGSMSNGRPGRTSTGPI